MNPLVYPLPGVLSLQANRKVSLRPCVSFFLLLAMGYRDTNVVILLGPCYDFNRKRVIFSNDNLHCMRNENAPGAAQDMLWIFTSQSGYSLLGN